MRIGPEHLIFLIPIIAILIGGLTTIVKMMTNHQKEMAEIFRQNSQTPELIDEIRSLRNELKEVKDQVNQQTLMLDRSPIDSGTVALRDRTTDT